VSTPQEEVKERILFFLDYSPRLFDGRLNLPAHTLELEAMEKEETKNYGL
jgi:hypothetical protein